MDTTTELLNPQAVLHELILWVRVHGFSQKEIAEVGEINQGNLSKVLNEERTVSEKLAAKICAFAHTKGATPPPLVAQLGQDHCFRIYLNGSLRSKPVVAVEVEFMRKVVKDAKKRLNRLPRVFLGEHELSEETLAWHLRQ